MEIFSVYNGTPTFKYQTSFGDDRTTRLMLKQQNQILRLIANATLKGEDKVVCIYIKRLKL